MILMSKNEYLKNPCRASSLPYWKSACMTVPEHMKILHHEDFSVQMLEQYLDEPYFRLKHDLQAVKPAAVPDGFSFCAASLQDFSNHINECYGAPCMTVEELQSFTERAVYCPELWIALKDEKTGKIAATGIAELDRSIGEGILEWVQVSEAYRHYGLGTCIVLELLGRMQSKAEFATVSGQCRNPGNPQGLYRKCGFVGDDVWHILRKR